MKSRFIISIVGNAFRACIVFLTGIIIARGLSPAEYGNLTFILGTFVSIRALIDMGTSSAFYTFISKSPRSKKFYLLYLSWLIAQFLITTLLVAVLIPNNLLQKIWLGNLRETVAVAFFASFAQQQIWQTICQIGESYRKTIQVQLLNISVTLIYLVCISILTISGTLTSYKVLWITVFIYSFFSFIGYRLLALNNFQFSNEYETMKSIFIEYKKYCQPLIAMAAMGFFSTFFDKWILQKYGGAEQQGYYQIAAQFSQVSLLITASILNVFWKEIAEASAKNNLTLVGNLYLKVNRTLVVLSSVIAGLFLPWSKDIVLIMLGKEYIDAWIVLSIMMLYPIYQSMSQIGATMFMAGGNTNKYVIISFFIMLVTLPLSYFAMAPGDSKNLSGLGLGAIGMASYMVISGVLSANIQSYILTRQYHLRFDWLHQVVGVPFILLLGFLIKYLVGIIWDQGFENLYDFIIPFIFTSMLYLISTIILIWLFPSITGLENNDIKIFIKK